MLAYVALGGLAGTVARYALSGWLQLHVGRGDFPAGTLLVNVVGSLVLGFPLRYATGSTVFSPELRAGLTIGFCGAFTTMSTFGYESVVLLGDGQYSQAAVYIAVTMLGSIVAVMAGAAIANQLL
ncbi:MAG: fluoride efflux transporter CrcB [Gemmatimonadales bacterium]